METKSALKSKTLWAAFIAAGLAFYPPVGEFIKANPEAYAAILAAVFGALRVISKDKIIIE